MNAVLDITTFSGRLLTIMHENGNDPERMKKQVREHVMKHVENKLGIVDKRIDTYGKYSLGDEEAHENLVEELHEFIANYIVLIR